MSNIQNINNIHPIYLKDLENIIDRTYKRYPLLSKPDITLIIKAFFESIRDILLDGNIISINGLFSNMHLILFNRTLNNKLHTIIKVKLSTPSVFKNE